MVRRFFFLMFPKWKITSITVRRYSKIFLRHILFRVFRIKCAKKSAPLQITVNDDDSRLTRYDQSSLINDHWSMNMRMARNVSYWRALKNRRNSHQINPQYDQRAVSNRASAATRFHSRYLNAHFTGFETINLIRRKL